MQEVLRALEKLIEAEGSQTAAAKKLGISPSHLSDVLNGRRQLSDKVLAKLGLKKTVIVEPITKKRF